GVVVMDEFHCYADPQRGWAWQVPLLELTNTQCVLMSGTLGDVSFFERDLTRRTGREVAVVSGAERPVPLTFDYSLEPIQDLLQRLVEQGPSPVSVVHFAQKDPVSRAQSRTPVTAPPRERPDQTATATAAVPF